MQLSGTFEPVYGGLQRSQSKAAADGVDALECAQIVHIVLHCLTVSEIQVIHSNLLCLSAEANPVDRSHEGGHQVWGLAL